MSERLVRRTKFDDRVVIGDVNGDFRDVFSKLAALHSKNKFALALICGNLFATPSKAGSNNEQEVQDLIDGKITVPLTTYFALSSTALPSSIQSKIDASAGEICENLFFIGKRSTITTSEGVRVVSLGGTLDSSLTVAASKDSGSSPFYSVGDARTLHGANNADILLTCDWPSDITTGSKVVIPTENTSSLPPQHQCISDLCTTLKPRYMFSSSSSMFYEREPFFHAPASGEETSADPGYAITRFISLASYGNVSKQKWIYAFTIDTKATAPLTIPPGVTASPFAFSSKKRALPTSEEQQAFSRFANGTGSDHHSHRGHKGKKRRNEPPPGPDECFFCLANANVATHLITSIGEEAYMTTAKGPLPETDTFTGLGCPGHMLIIPLSHSPTISSIMDPESRSSTAKEMTRFRGVLNNMLVEKADGQLGSVCWEVSRAGGIHVHWQWMPIGAELLRKGLVEAAFKVQAENEKYPPMTETDIGAEQVRDEATQGDSFNVWLWTPPTMAGGHELVKSKEKLLNMPLDPSFRFDLQHGRKVIAKLLGLDHRADWRACKQSEADEKRDAERLKEIFKKFDFTLE